MAFHKKLESVQKKLFQLRFDGWLFYDFRRNNDLAIEFLEIPEEKIFTRRFFYWIPVKGEPVKILHRIEAENLEHLPGKTLPYLSWLDLENALEKLLREANVIAMEYSPRNAIPYMSKVDAGTMDLILEFVESVHSSADLLQQFTSVWDDYKLQMHLEATSSLDQIVGKAWQKIRDSLETQQAISEYDVQQFILDQFTQRGLTTEDAPICAVNENSADPHYQPFKETAREIRKGDFILIDLWCKKDMPNATYGDITRVGVAAGQASEKQEKIFQIVKKARDRACDLVKESFAEGKDLKGWEVDASCRKVIEDAGFGEFFIHRTGHNIDTKDHGNGAHIDNLETQDRRSLLARTCFSIEPGIYLPGEFGVRLEYDVFIEEDGSVLVTGGIQEEITCLFSNSFIAEDR